jgi:hypothetical protein
MSAGFRRLSILLALAGFLVGFGWIAMSRRPLTEGMVEGAYLAIVGAVVAVLLSWMNVASKKRR